MLALVGWIDDERLTPRPLLFELILSLNFLKTLRPLAYTMYYDSKLVTMLTSAAMPVWSSETPALTMP
jgi:hypothetical protein